MRQDCRVAYCLAITVFFQFSEKGKRSSPVDPVLEVEGGETTINCKGQSQDITFDEKGESKRGIELTLSVYQNNALPVGQTGSLTKMV